MTESSRDPRVSKYFSIEQGQALVDAWRQSGLSRSAFARERGVGVHVLQYWSQKLSAPRGASITTQPSSSAFMQVTLPSVSRSLSSPLMIQFSRGAVVHVGVGADADLLRTVLLSLSASC
jgi:hypothetical protein